MKPGNVSSRATFTVPALTLAIFAWEAGLVDAELTPEAAMPASIDTAAAAVATLRPMTRRLPDCSMCPPCCHPPEDAPSGPETTGRRRLPAVPEKRSGFVMPCTGKSPERAAIRERSVTDEHGIRTSGDRRRRSRPALRRSALATPSGDAGPPRPRRCPGRAGSARRRREGRAGERRADELGDPVDAVAPRTTARARRGPGRAPAGRRTSPCRPAPRSPRPGAARRRPGRSPRRRHRRSAASGSAARQSWTARTATGWIAAPDRPAAAAHRAARRRDSRSIAMPRTVFTERDRLGPRPERPRRRSRRGRRRSATSLAQRGSPAAPAASTASAVADGRVGEHPAAGPRGSGRRR